jgi:hypothetical protein
LLASDSFAACKQVPPAATGRIGLVGFCRLERRGFLACSCGNRQDLAGGALSPPCRPFLAATGKSIHGRRCACNFSTRAVFFLATTQSP